MRELEADVGVQLALVDLVEHPVVELGTELGLFGVGDVFAKVVYADARAPFVYDLGGANYVMQMGAGDEALRKSEPEGRLFGEVAKSLAFRQTNKERPQHVAAPVPSGNGRKTLVW